MEGWLMKWIGCGRKQPMEGLRRTTNSSARIEAVPAEIQTEYLLDSNTELL
jgi:hypothetical protein